MGEYRVTCKDGSKLTCELYAKFLADSLIVTFNDITGRKQAEQEIHKLNAELEQRVEARTHELREAQEQLLRQERLAVLGQLAGGVGHELRNPLSVILNATYYLKLTQPQVDEKTRHYFGMIDEEARRAEKIVNDLLDFARVPSVNQEAVPVPGLVARVLSRYPAPPSIKVTHELPADLPSLFVDPRHAEQVLGNLVQNACQAMEAGGKLEISAKEVKGRKPKQADAGMVAISVKDSGSGIPPENMKKLFEPLFTTKLKGIGLGLAVCRQLAEANGGRIEVQSQPGKGSTFILFLPVKA